ncbi:MAG: hypothetical protein ACO1OO_07550 [Flavisolibacter sp.]
MPASTPERMDQGQYEGTDVSTGSQTPEAVTSPTSGSESMGGAEGNTNAS